MSTVSRATASSRRCDSGRYYRYRLEAIERWEARSEQGPVIATQAA
jgi:hypothetical protein